ncbi:hypothetical protein GA0115261_118503, partial [Streptomyces sp. OspMP-M43]
PPPRRCERPSDGAPVGSGAPSDGRASAQAPAGESLGVNSVTWVIQGAL